MSSGLVRKRVAWFSRLLFSLSVMIGMASCASYDKSVENPSFLNKTNYKKLNGTYQANTKKDSFRFSTGDWYVYDYNFLHEIDRKLWKDTLGLDTVSEYSFRLEARSQKSLRVLYLKNDSVFRERNLKTRLTNKGYIQLKNKNLKIIGLPGIAGGYDQKRIRLTVNDNNDLVIDNAEGSYAAMMILYGGISSSSQRMVFESRIKNNN